MKSKYTASPIDGELLAHADSTSFEVANLRESQPPADSVSDAVLSRRVSGSRERGLREAANAQRSAL